MMRVTEPLRSEHANLLPRLEVLRGAAVAVEAPNDELPRAVDDAIAFLRESLIPHAEADDAALYPKAEQVMNAPGASATMTRDHVEVVRLAADLQRVHDSIRGATDPGLLRELQRILYGLYAIIRLHFAKEEEAYLPLLDAGLAPAEADDMFRAMHEFASTGGSAPHSAKHHQSNANH